jgi:biofilm PGA synthesis N-glycosyltransferase PgaC
MMGRRYLAITPARDEEYLLPGVIASLKAQTLTPDRWILIDDGSRDFTPEIADAAAAQWPWIEVYHLDRSRERALGGESVIMNFLPREQWSAYDFILRLDADLTFDPQLVELLIDEFEKDPKLGVAGAVLYEPSGSRWREVKTPHFHTHGAIKIYSSKCFEAIGGLQAGIGWDTIDEAHAMMLGFKSRSFRHIVAYHHRPQGAAGGMLRGRFGTGQTAYVLGYSPVFMLARTAAKIFSRPIVLGSIMMLAGYLDGYWRQLPLSASPELVRFIRRQQIRRLLMLESAWR